MNKVLEFFISRPVTQSDIDLDDYLSGFFSEDELFVRKKAVIRSLIQNSIDYLQGEIDSTLLSYRFCLLIGLISKNYGDIQTMFNGYPLTAVEFVKLLDRVEMKLKEDGVFNYIFRGRAICSKESDYSLINSKFHRLFSRRN